MKLLGLLQSALHKTWPEARLAGNRLYSLMEKGSDDSAALNMSFMHQSVEVGQQGVSGLKDFSGEHLKR